MLKIQKEYNEYGSEIYPDGSTKDLTEMARIGFFGKDNYEIYVNTDDGGHVPHFHIRNAKGWEKFHTCIEIKEAKYFKHGNKQDELNSRQRKELCIFLKSKPEDDHYETNWDLIISMWNINNSSEKISKDRQMPDYTKLK